MCQTDLNKAVGEKYFQRRKHGLEKREEKVYWGMKAKVFVAQLCLTLRDPMDWNSPVSSVHGILQARILKWVSTSFFRGSSLPRDWTLVSYIAGRLFTIWATKEACYWRITGIQHLHTFNVHILMSLDLHILLWYFSRYLEIFPSHIISPSHNKYLHHIQTCPCVISWVAWCGLGFLWSFLCVAWWGLGFLSHKNT